jgi:hypothetical protein
MKSLLIGATLVLCVAGGAANVFAQPFVRESIHEFAKDPDKLASLIKGVQEMRRRNSAPVDSAEYRTSWEYWANIHGYPGPNARSGTVANVQKRLQQLAPEDAPLYAGFFAGLKDLTPPDQLAQEVWDTCEHGNRGGPARHFLSWHRMYLYFFERVLRQASGNSKLTLPYWDYTSTKTSTAGEQLWVLPSIFGQPFLAGPNNVVNPLYEKRRTAGFAENVQVDINNQFTNVDSLLTLDEFFDFSGSLEAGTHGFIHCTVGNNCLAPYIGIVPFAGNDPLFWLHHANIDRLWDCWTTAHGREGNPLKDSGWMSQPYAFVDEKGNRAEMKVSELFDLGGRIDYTYDNVKDCYRQPPASPSVAVAMNIAAAKGGRTVTTTAQISKASNLVIDKPDQTVSIAFPNTAPAQETLFRAVRPHALQPTRVLLRLSGLQLSNDPGSSIAVNLIDPRNRNKVFVGSLSFFGWFGHDHGPTPQGEGRDFVFDITAQFQQLYSSSVANAPLLVAFVATDGLAIARRPINAARYRAAGVRLREISIEALSGSVILDLK